MIKLIKRAGRVLSIGLALLLAAGVFDGGAALAAGPQDNVRSFYDLLLATMKDGRALGQSGRYARLAPAVNRTFDIPSMVRLAVGPSWVSLSPADQQRVTEAFAHYVGATYADRFDSYAGQQLEVTGERPYNGQVIVQTKIVKSNGEVTNIDYLMRQNQGTWNVSDVYLDGTISQLAVRRSELDLSFVEKASMALSSR
jgi:phospholipid transport system substrate-binding protein